MVNWYEDQMTMHDIAARAQCLCRKISTINFALLLSLSNDTLACKGERCWTAGDALMAGLKDHTVSSILKSTYTILNQHITEL